ncbi:hypothetical protein WN943_003471 [Citrus x changshan-huyou]
MAAGGGNLPLSKPPYTPVTSPLAGNNHHNRTHTQTKGQKRVRNVESCPSPPPHLPPLTATALRDNAGWAEVTKPSSSIKDDLGIQRLDEELSSDENPVADDYITSEPEHSGGGDLDPNFSVVSPHSSSSRKDFTLVIGHRF